MRLFIGIPIPDEYVRSIQEVQSAWKGRLASRVSWVRPGLAHLTLKFLGKRTKPGRGHCRRHADRRRGEFRHAGRSGRFFPPRGAPRVVWLGFSRGVQECGAYFAALDAALARVGFAAETRPFAAHVTVARVKDAAKGDDWAGLAADLTRDWPPFTVENAVLWQSVLQSSGPQYRKLREVPLKA